MPSSKVNRGGMREGKRSRDYAALGEVSWGLNSERVCMYV